MHANGASRPRGSGSGNASPRRRAMPRCRSKAATRLDEKHLGDFAATAPTSARRGTSIPGLARNQGCRRRERPRSAARASGDVFVNSARFVGAESCSMAGGAAWWRPCEGVSSFWPWLAARRALRRRKATSAGCRLPSRWRRMPGRAKAMRAGPMPAPPRAPLVAAPPSLPTAGRASPQAWGGSSPSLAGGAHPGPSRVGRALRGGAPTMALAAPSGMPASFRM